MPDDPREPYGRLVHDTRLAAEADRAAAEGRQVFRLGTWESRSGPQREADMRIGAAVAAAERERIRDLVATRFKTVLVQPDNGYPVDAVPWSPLAGLLTSGLEARSEVEKGPDFMTDFIPGPGTEPS